MANKTTQQQLQQMCEDAGTLGFRPERLLLLDQRLTEWSKTDMTPSIVVRVQRHGQLAFEGAYGIQGPGKEPDSLTADAIFPVCSVTKPITSTLLHILQEEGLIDLNRPVKEFLPEFTGDPDGLVHIWHLLSHSSGIVEKEMEQKFDEYVLNELSIVMPKDEAPDEDWNKAFAKVREKLKLPPMEDGPEMRHATYFTVALSLPPSYKPQTVMSYCSFGYHMAMEIVKRLCGMPIEAYARQKLFGPLGMKDSSFYFPREELGRYVTRGEDYCGSQWLNEDILDSDSGAGGLKTTVEDLTRFGQMFLNKGKLDGVRVLSAASVREMTSDHNSRLPQSKYNGEMFDSNWGLGFNVKAIKTDCSGMLRSARAFDQDGYGCSSILCDPDMDFVAAYFTVSKTNSYLNLSNFINMVASAIEK